ncbi:hypothetical protein MKY91_03645 [Alkalicoccobacillus gibsonii]|uniref:DUF2254 domain-containing protein n=1 Tax=Alkalicoccobacillus gibsonii TaxID=79881 RepID=A0ABU9VEC7_9BACI
MYEANSLKFIVKFIVILVICFLFVNWIAKLLNLKILYYVGFFANRFDIFGFDLNTVLVENVTSLAYRSFLFITPVSIAFFYFIYKELISWSSKKQFTNLFLIYIISLVVFFVTNLRLNLAIISNEKLQTIELLIFLWSITGIIYFSQFVRIVLNSISQINIEQLFERNNHEFKSSLDSLYFSNNEHRISHFNNLHETINTFHHALEHNINTKRYHAFNRNLDIWEKNILEIMDGTPRSLSKNEKDKKVNEMLYLSKFAELHLEETKVFYGSIFKILVDLYTKKTQSNNISMSFVEYMRPNRVPKLYKTYIESLEEFGMELLSFPSDFDKYLTELRSVYINDPELKGLNHFGSHSIHYSLMLECINSKNIQALTVLANSLTMDNKSTLDNHMSVLSTKDFSIYDKKSRKKISLPDSEMAELKFKILKGLFDKLSEDGQEVIYIFLKIIYISVEVGYYGGTGFLVKRLFTEFKDEDIQKSFESFIHFKGNIREYIFNARDLKPEIFYKYHDLEDIEYKDHSFEYCTQKMLILFNLQSNYLRLKKVGHKDNWCNRKARICLNKINPDYLSYIFDKVINASGKYGLLAVKENKLVLDYKRFLIREISLSKRS